VVKRNVVVAALGTTQTLAWGSSYYLPAILAEPIAQGLGLFASDGVRGLLGISAIGIQPAVPLLHLQLFTGF
jgi:hypothetical protein